MTTSVSIRLWKLLSVFILHLALQSSVVTLSDQTSLLLPTLSPAFDPSQIEFPASSAGSLSGKTLFTGLYSGPYFDRTGTPNNVTSQAGGVALLPCRVKQLGSKVVSWVRSRDAHLLGVDDVTFISDSRFKILKPEKPGDEWNLHIKPVLASDEGNYECQISTAVKMSHYVHLQVLVPKVEIEGGGGGHDAEVARESGDIHAQAGSTVTLKCSISKVLNRPKDVRWYKDNDPIPLDVNSPIRVKANSSREFESILFLEQVGSAQAGRYSCLPQMRNGLAMPSATVNLHVVNGETLAAMSDTGEQEAVQATSTGSLRSETSTIRLVVMLLAGLTMIIK